MKRNLAETIRLISRKGKNSFISSLKEELNDRFYKNMANFYLTISENLYKDENEEENIQESMKMVGGPSSTIFVDAGKKQESAPITGPKKRSFTKMPKPGQMKEQNFSDDLISSLQESIRDEKTIIHRFNNGDTIPITNEDSQAIVRLHDSLNKINQEKMRKLMSENYSEYNKILQFSKKYTERTHK